MNVASGSAQLFQYGHQRVDALIVAANLDGSPLADDLKAQHENDPSSATCGAPTVAQAAASAPKSGRITSRSARTIRGRGAGRWQKCAWAWWGEALSPSCTCMPISASTGSRRT